MKKKFFFIIFLLLSFSCAQAQDFDPQLLKNEVAGLEQTIIKIKAESAKYAGGLIKALLDSRLQIYEHTKAMLEQRLAAGNYRIAIKYTIDGKEYVAPLDKDKIIKDLEGEALAVTKEIEDTQKEADQYSGGLVRAMKLSTVATLQQQLAMIEMKRCALIFDIPIFAFLGKASTPPTSPPTEETKEIASEIDSMFDIKLVGKRVFEANYATHLGFNFIFTNHTDKDIKAVKGIAHFTDLFNTDITSINFTIEKPIPAGQSVKNNDYSIELNQFNDVDNRLRSITMENLKMRFEVQSIIFRDGSIINR